MVVFRQTGLVKYFLNVFHSVCARIRRDGARLPHGVDMSHIANWWGDDLIVIPDSVVEFFVSGVGFGDQVILEFIRIVGSS